MTPQALISFVSSRRFPLGNEKEVQKCLADELSANGIPFEREFRLNAQDIVDFMFAETGMVAELKIKKGARLIHAQCNRYCRHERVTSLVLVTNAAMGLPPLIEGKPTYVVSLGRGWL